MKTHLDDLGSPRFTPAVTEVLKAMAAMAPGCLLEPDALLAAARDQTGLDDFGGTSFLEPLEVLCTALREEAGLSLYGLTAQYIQLVQLLSNRLRVEDLVHRHPEILDIEIKAPIVIAGMVRTGTTHLQNLLAADPALTHLPYWEAVEPVPPPGDAPGGRLERTIAALDFVHEAMPHFRSMFDITPTHAHEDINLLALEMSSMHFEVQAMIPSYRDWYRAADQTFAYAYLKKALQVLTWLRGGDRWILKSPQHLEQLEPLLTVFPDAFVVITHRDPVAVTGSMATMICYALRMASDEIDPHAVGRYWAARGTDLLDRCMLDRDLLPPGQSIDVRFHEYMADNLAVVREIYRRSGQPYSPGARKALEDYLRDHERGRHGQVDYRLSDIGLDEDTLREQLSPYAERFGLPVDRR